VAIDLCAFGSSQYFKLSMGGGLRAVFLALNNLGIGLPQESFKQAANQM
jgi:hypothetical protein